MLRKTQTIRYFFTITGLLPSITLAQEGWQGNPYNDYAPYPEPVVANDQAATNDGPPPPIPPYVVEAPIQMQGGGYCFDGAHPLDARVSNGATWDATPGRHIHPFPPFDLRLFNQRNGCYYFIGDPNDFGHMGQTYRYYGAHPIHEMYGGGWCFMIGGHHHLWRPWSTAFVTVGPWYYWEGPYDPVFWTYWPYYHFYYRSHYPRYYSGGVFSRARIVAPRITHVPPPPRTGIGGWHGPRSGGYDRAAPIRSAPPGYQRAPIVPPRGPANRALPAAPRSFSPPRTIAPPARSMPGHSGESFRRGPRH